MSYCTRDSKVYCPFFTDTFMVLSFLSLFFTLIHNNVCVNILRLIESLNCFEETLFKNNNEILLCLMSLCV